MMKHLLRTVALAAGLAGAAAPLMADTATPGAAGPRVTAPAPRFQLAPRPTQPPGGAVGQLFGIVDPSGPDRFSAGAGGLGDTQICCDANDNCTPLPPPGVCPAGTITSWCDEDNNCVDEDDDE